METFYSVTVSFPFGNSGIWWERHSSAMHLVLSPEWTSVSFCCDCRDETLPAHHPPSGDGAAIPSGLGGGVHPGAAHGGAERGAGVGERVEQSGTPVSPHTTGKVPTCYCNTVIHHKVRETSLESSVSQPVARGPQVAHRVALTEWNDRPQCRHTVLLSCCPLGAIRHRCYVCLLNRSIVTGSWRGCGDASRSTCALLHCPLLTGRLGLRRRPLTCRSSCRPSGVPAPQTASWPRAPTSLTPRSSPSPGWGACTVAAWWENNHCC